MDFTFVCPTELIAFNAKLEEFKKRNCQVLGVFVDSEYTHLTWKNSPPGLGGVGEIGYPRRLGVPGLRGGQGYVRTPVKYVS